MTDKPEWFSCVRDEWFDEEERHPISDERLDSVLRVMTGHGHEGEGYFGFEVKSALRELISARAALAKLREAWIEP